MGTLQTESKIKSKSGLKPVLAPGEAYRVLIVDDELVIARYHAALLEKAGMTVQILNNPEKILSALEENNPDIVLLDMYMPKRTGLEVAAILRRQEMFAGLPIVFLSSENRPRQQLALQSDGDDFLMKPVDPVRLLTSVVSRAKRGRIMRALMMQDSLTGLLHHKAIKARLETEVTRAERHQTALSFAIIDIDHFKDVNDTHGHPVGDRVIKTLSELLQKRLRQSTVVGRYGGEEFAIIFENCNAADATKVLDELRQNFSRVEQWSDLGTFQVTFSAGVAEFVSGGNTTQLISAADHALYTSKHAGRNRVTSV